MNIFATPLEYVSYFLNLVSRCVRLFNPIYLTTLYRSKILCVLLF